jgi:DNA-binding transcriptional ArsR family regulator
MLRIHFTSEDVARVSLAADVDPLWEVLFSLHLLQERDDTLLFGEWRRRARAKRPPRLGLLAELAPPQGYSADFLTPGRGELDLAGSVDRVLSTPRRRLREDLTFLAGQQAPTAWTRALADGDRAALDQLVAALRDYHRLALAPYQDQMRAQIQADRSRRAQALLAGGVNRLLTTLHPRVRWEFPVLQVLDYPEHDVHLQGRGLVLLPSLFCRRRPITLRDTDLAPVLVYPATPGLGWLNPAASPAKSVAALVGRARAAALQATVSPCSTTELARRIELSPAAASRQAAVLREAGLIVTRRDGGMVLHQITGLGIALLNGRLPT